MYLEGVFDRTRSSNHNRRRGDANAGSCPELARREGSVNCGIGEGQARGDDAEHRRDACATDQCQKVAKSRGIKPNQTKSNRVESDEGRVAGDGKALGAIPSFWFAGWGSRSASGGRWPQGKSKRIKPNQTWPRCSEVRNDVKGRDWSGQAGVEVRGNRGGSHSKPHIANSRRGANRRRRRAEN